MLKDVIQQYSDLKEIQMNDNNKMTELPIHVIIAASKYHKVKTKRNIRFRNRGEPVTEYTVFGGQLYLADKKQQKNHMKLTRDKKVDYAELCQLDALSSEEQQNNGKRKLSQEFKDQIGRSQERWYKNSFLWKTNSNELSTNKAISLARLRVLLRKLNKNPMLFDQYHEIICNQLGQGIVERTTNG